MSLPERMEAAFEQIRFAQEEFGKLYVGDPTYLGPDVPPEFRRLCQSTLNNLRQALEYTAGAIKARHCTAFKGPPGYFPICGDRKTFESHMGRNFPDLKQNAPAIFDYLESIQPYNSAYNWMGEFNNYVNMQTKHSHLKVKKEKQSRHILGTLDQGYTIGPIIVGKGVRGPLGQVTIDGVPLQPIEFRSDEAGDRFDSSPFEFAGSGQVVCDRLAEYIGGVKTIVTRIAALLDLPSAPSP
jgi:hypothetical protein